MADERDDGAGAASGAATGGECPNCGRSLAGVTGRDQGRGVERATCPACALQLVRRGGGAWEGIRG